MRRLQGDEFRSIIENAPLKSNNLIYWESMVNTKTKHSEGEITADIIKEVNVCNNRSQMRGF